MGKWTLFPAIALIFLVQNIGANKSFNIFNNLLDKIEYHLFTKESPFQGQLLLTGNSSLLQNSDFDPNKRIKFIFHGIEENVHSAVDSPQTLLRGYMCKESDVNFILVGYKTLIIDTFNENYIHIYFKKYAEVLANRMNGFLKFLKNEYKQIKNSQIDFLGFSLGATIASYLGRLQPVKDKIANIIAFDPAAPIYAIHPGALNITRDDAEYVEVIHSSSPYGLYPGYGHGDIYINFAGIQKHCDGTFDVLCNHIYSVDVFSAALCNRSKFPLDHCMLNEIIIKKCPDDDLSQRMFFGDEPLPSKFGTYSVRTAIRPIHQRTSIINRLLFNFYHETTD